VEREQVWKDRWCREDRLRHAWDKLRAEAAHFKTRLRQRYGIEINRFEYAAMCDAAEDAPVIQRQSCRVSVRVLKVGRYDVPCVYDERRCRLVTVLYEQENL
jgi:hypothetical protein